MKKEAVLGFMITLIVVSMLVLAFNIQLVKASGTVYIRAGGSVDPPTAPIQRDGDVYTLTDNIYDSIVVERDNIVVDGAGYTLQGTRSGKGIDLSGRSNVTIKNTEIKSFGHGIVLDSSPNSTVSGNNITNNGNGTLLYNSSNNTIYHNNFVNNTRQVYDISWDYPFTPSINVWDNGYPSGGNYWSDYTGEDQNGDGIGDTPYVIDEDNQDNCPLMRPTWITVEEVPFWTQWWFWAMVAVVIVALGGTVYFLKKRKPPTAPPPPPETSVE